MYKPINIKMFGAKGDGITDDTLSIQQAIDTAQSTNNKLFIPSSASYYNITSSLRITSKLVVEGESPYGSVIRAAIPHRFAIEFIGQPAEGSVLKNVGVLNPNAGAICFVFAGKSLIQNVYTTFGIGAMAFWNGGSQQLILDRCNFSTNMTKLSDSSAAPRYGYVGTCYGLIGSTIGDPDNTGLNGLTLSYTFWSSVTTSAISGNTVEDVRDALNAITSTGGLYAFVDGNRKLILAPRPWETSTWTLGIDNDIVLSNGTGGWSSVGHTANTYTTGTTTFTTNASSISNSAIEGHNTVGVYLDGRRHPDTFTGGHFISNSVFQGNGTHPTNGDYRADLVIRNAANVNISNIWIEGDSTQYNAVLDNAHNAYIQGTNIGRILMRETKYASWNGCYFNGNAALGNSLVENTCYRTLFVSCETPLSGSTAGFNDRGIGSSYVNCRGNNARANDGTLQNNADNTGAGTVLNINGDFKFWDISGLLPLGYSVYSGASITQTSDAAQGQYACQISGVAGAGLKYTIPRDELGGLSSDVGEFITVQMTAKRPSSSLSEDIGIIIVQGSGIKGTDTSATTYDLAFPSGTWVTRRFAVQLTTDTNDVDVIITPASLGVAGSLIVDSISIVRGLVAPNIGGKSTGESKSLFLDGKYIDYGSGIPTDGYYPIGSLRFNNAPTPGGLIGWTCISGGSPGTWKTFGSISS